MSGALWGAWVFVGLIYQGHNLPPPNPDLRLEYRFEESGRNTLSYHRRNERGFCEREALYRWDGSVLYQKVETLHPDNAPWCGDDRDMQAGFESWSRAWIENDRFHLALSLGEEEIIYLWDRQPVAGITAEPSDVRLREQRRRSDQGDEDPAAPGCSPIFSFSARKARAGVFSRWTEAVPE